MNITREDIELLVREPSPAMRQRIAEVLGLQPDQINIKAKTAEKMGPVGQGDAMEARAIALLFR